jgi:uncharacterized RDD family membrane protein YckC
MYLANSPKSAPERINMPTRAISATEPSKRLGQGVYYSSEAYAGLYARLLIIAIDLTVLIVVGRLLSAVFYDGMRGREDTDPSLFASWLAAAYIYLVFLKASPLGTLGFLLTRVKIVNLRGERPSYLAMTLRLLCFFGPFDPIINYFWLTGDPNRQTLRDKLVGTYIVRKKAVPSGKGNIALVQYFLFGWSMLFPEVQRRRLKE